MSLVKRDDTISKVTSDLCEINNVTKVHVIFGYTHSRPTILTMVTRYDWKQHDVLNTGLPISTDPNIPTPMTPEKIRTNNTLSTMS